MKTDGMAFVSAVADACGVELGKVSALTIHFDAPNSFAEVTVRMFVGSELTPVLKKFRMTAEESRGSVMNAPATIHAKLADTKLLKVRAAAALVGVAEATLYRRAASDPTFPKLIKFGKRCTRINASDLVTWLEKQGTK